MTFSEMSFFFIIRMRDPLFSESDVNVSSFGYLGSKTFFPFN